MISAISGFSPYQATSGVYNVSKVTTPQEDLRELSSVASSYYSVSDTVQPLKTATESDSRWLYRAVSNELGMPNGVNIDGLAENPARITVNLSGIELFSNPTQSSVVESSQNEYLTQENSGELNSNAYEENLAEYAQEYFAQNTDEAVSHVAQAIDLNTEDIINGKENKPSSQNFFQKMAANKYKQINLNYINSYV